MAILDLSTQAGRDAANARDKTYNQDNGLPGAAMLNSMGGGGSVGMYGPGAPAAVPVPQKPPIPQFQAGNQVDLTGYKTAVTGSKPGENQFNMADLKTAVDNPAKNGSTVNLDWLRTALGKKPGDTFNMTDLQSLMNGQKTAGTTNKFTLDQLQGSIDGAKNAGGAVPVQAYQYQNPEQFQKVLTQMNQVLAPLTQAQKGAAQTSYGQASQALDNKWSRNGLLASGGAAAEQQQGANALASQMQGIEAQQQANALPMAFNFANLSMNEDQQKFAQNANNRDFGAQQAQNNVGNVLSGLGAQMNQNQFDFSKSQAGVGNMLSALGLQGQQQQQWMQNAQNQAGMDIGQNQWAQQFGQQVKQSDVNNQLAGIGLQDTQMQNYLRNLQNATGMDVSQNQWAQQFGLQRQQSEMGNDLNWAQLQQGGNQFNANLQNNQSQFYDNLANRKNEFGTGTMMDMLKMAQQQGQFQQGMDAQNKQSNWNAYKDNVAMTGNMGDGPKQDWGQYGNNGQMSAQQQNAMMQMMMGQADRMPFMPNNMSQYMQNMPAYKGMGNFLDSMGGQANQNTWNTQEQTKQWEKEYGLKAQSQAITSLNSQSERGYKNWLMDRGIKEDMAKDNTNSFVTQIMSQGKREDAIKYITDHDKDIGAAGIDMRQVTSAMDQKWGNVNAPKNNNPQIMNNAVKAAQLDPRWYEATTPQEHQTLINEYAQYYQAP